MASYQPYFPAVAILVLFICGQDMEEAGPVGPKELWKFETGGWISSKPAVEEGVVCVVSKDGHLHAVDAATGQEIWKVELGAQFTLSAPAVHRGRVYVGTSDGRLIGLDGQTGFEQWKFKAGGKIISSPVIWENVIYFGSDDRHLYAVLL